MNRMQELVAHADGIAMRLEYHTVERIGYDENRKTGASLKLHLLPDSGLYASVSINTENYGRRQAFYRSRLIFLVCGT